MPLSAAASAREILTGLHDIMAGRFRVPPFVDVSAERKAISADARIEEGATNEAVRNTVANLVVGLVAASAGVALMAVL